MKTFAEVKTFRKAGKLLKNAKSHFQYAKNRQIDTQTKKPLK